jgi:RHS repeat-associated protein
MDKKASSLLTAGYTGDGLRAWKESSSVRTYFIYDGALPLLELDNIGAIVSTNTSGANGLISRRTGSTSVFYVFDSEGSVSQRTDSSGNILSDHLYSAFGEQLSGSQTDAFGYRAQFGYYSDNETGLQLLTHRYYDPTRGRFVTRDPISYDGGVNLYSYVTNNPINFLDPLGLAKLVYWGPAKDSKRGHVALLLDDGTYISYWPTCFFGKDPQPFKQCPSREADYEKDKADEGRDPFFIHIDGLNERAIKDWWNNGKGHGDFSLMNNCSDIVGQALKVGGMPYRTQSLYTTPDDVKSQVEQYMHNRAYPPPVPQPPPSPVPRQP